jgi:hypothetical protein
MTARDIAKALAAARPNGATARSKEAFVVLPLAEYERLREALEDAQDLIALDEARRENAGQPGIPFAEVKRRLDSAKKRRRKRGSKAA